MTQRTAHYLTHPQVNIDANLDVPKWSLSDIGKARVAKLVSKIQNQQVLSEVKSVISSDETKAIETGQPIAEALGCSFHIVEAMHENDRSATGFLPPEEFERVADQFFAHPDQSIRGWERAIDAQKRILYAVNKVLEDNSCSGSLLFVGHGGVGTLLYCALAGKQIDRQYDQGPGGGGCFFSFDINSRKVLHHWKVMEEMG